MANAAKYTIRYNTTGQKTIGGLQTGKTYYVRVRAYKLIDGVKYYGKYSSIRSVKIHS